MEEVDETDAQPQVYLACIMNGRRVGISYYDSSICQLHVLEFWEDENEGFPLVEMVKYQAQPRIIYTSTKSGQSLFAALQDNGDGTAEAPTVKAVKSSLFSYEQAWHRLMYLQVTGMDEGLSIKERVSVIPLVSSIENQAVINSYPKFMFTKRNGNGGDDTVCSICLTEYKESEMPRILPDCRHYFHVVCVDAWLKLNASCPVCRNSPLPTPLSTPLQEVVPLSQYLDGRRRQ